jgi:hypothetical protein
VSRYLSRASFLAGHTILSQMETATDVCVRTSVFDTLHCEMDVRDMPEKYRFFRGCPSQS